MAKTKKCTRCKGRPKPIDDFAKSPHSADGDMNVCRKCWSKALSASKKKARKEREARTASPRASKSGKNGVDSANKALKKANGTKDRFMVRADDGDQKEFRSEAAALRKAMEWKIDGYQVEVWRQCQLELVARIRG